MKPKIKLYKSGAYATMDKSGMWYEVLARNPAGEVIDKIRCDDYRDALDYYRAFSALAKVAK